MDRWVKTLSSFLGVGYFPRCPGTAASLAALFIVSQTGTRGAGYYLSLIGLIGISCLLAYPSQKVFKEKDPQVFVLDEVAGIFVSFFWVSLNAVTLIGGFVLFRFFDIRKPFFIRRVESWNSPLAIVADDLLAGLYVNGVLHLARPLLIHIAGR